MTEEQWLAGTEPERMLGFLQGNVSDRKLRHFLVACARRVLPASPDEDMLPALAVAEQFADGEVSRGRLASSRKALTTQHAARVARWPLLYTPHIRSVPTWHATRGQVVRAAREGSRTCAWASTRRVFFGGLVGMTYPQEELAAQASLLRDIVGNPFRPTPSIGPAWLAWDGGTVKRLAQDAYEQRVMPAGMLDPERLAVLADALEEAGCTDPAILGHLRQQGTVHVRGCFVVDLLLGKV
jgi:hypothetical protein